MYIKVERVLIYTIIHDRFCLYHHKRASLACAARLADTLCPPEAAFEYLNSHSLIIREITSLNMYLLLLKWYHSKQQICQFLI